MNNRRRAAINRIIKQINTELKPMMQKLQQEIEDVDQTVVSQGQALIGSFEEYEETVNAAVEWLNETADYQ
ncbi:hypothetical protein [Alterisphingorhabdus coralli]|uniref:Uncharacterized protein n=1 Tax=Alterisphingorhabdus coralli TaxID=3071408 RepID=A0AA97FCU6_9SPHN|nr:hypothetical protein [Parasphingorhabdus sp. SCSIO 66989]WOE76720.1 hypothetical protein RB602_15150 [Parasphingorhabdus sp. SCSIO 66989]